MTKNSFNDFISKIVSLEGTYGKNFNIYGEGLPEINGIEEYLVELTQEDIVEAGIIAERKK